MYTDKTAIQNYLLTTIDDSFDDQIDEWVTAMSTYIDRMTNRTFAVPDGDTEKLYDGNGRDFLVIDDLLDVTSIEIDGTALETDQYFLYPANKTPKTKVVLNANTFNKGLQNVAITGEFGYASEIPSEIKWACTVLVSGIINASNSHQGEVQSETIGRYSVTYNNEKQLNDFQEAQKIIKSYKRFAI